MNLKRGYIVPSFAVCCHRCGAHEAIMQARTQSEAVKLAKSAGWVFTRAFGWLCEDCDK